MNASNYLPTDDDTLSQWLQNFLAVARERRADLRLTVAELNALQTGTGVFDSKTRAAYDAHVAALAATVARAQARKAVVAQARALVKRLQTTPGMDDVLRVQLKIAVTQKRRGVIPVFTPAVLSAAVRPDMSIGLKWERGGNTYGTGYVVERESGDGGAWTMLRQVTATRFVDETLPPGVNATYRVLATRGKQTSMPSNEARVYPQSAAMSAA